MRWLMSPMLAETPYGETRMKLSTLIGALQQLAAETQDDPHVYGPVDDHGNRFMVFDVSLQHLNPMGDGQRVQMPGVLLEMRHASHHVDVAEQYNRLADAAAWRME